MEPVQTSYIAGTPYVGAEVKMYHGPGGHRGEFAAWDIVAAKKVWTIREDFPVWSGALVTAGDVAFYGTMDGWFKAVDARNGKVLWQFRTGSGIIAQPVTYRGPGGKQYIAVLSGVGGWPGAIVSGDLDARVEYTWWSQRRGFLRNTLNMGTCDVVMGVPTSLDMVLRTEPYYRSSYVFVTRPDFGSVPRTFDDARLAHARIGVQMIGND